MDRKQLESEITQYTETFRQAREQSFRLEGIILYLQQALSKLNEADKDGVQADANTKE